MQKTSITYVVYCAAGLNTTMSTQAIMKNGINHINSPRALQMGESSSLMAF